MIYAIVEDGVIKRYPYTIDDLRRDNPTVSFPNTLSEEDLTTFNLVPYMETSQPLYDKNVYVVERTDPVFENGRVVVRWQLSPRRDAADMIRRQRDKLLTDSDWTQMADSPLSDEVKELLAQYRQVIRDVPNQEGFPLFYYFPEKP